MVTPIVWIEDLPNAGGAACLVRRNAKLVDVAAVADTCCDVESLVSLYHGCFSTHGSNTRRDGCSLNEKLLETINTMRLALNVDQDAIRIVAYPTGKAQLARKAIHERPKADALHDAAYTKACGCLFSNRTGEGECTMHGRLPSRWRRLIILIGSAF
jgi:hypothetical protein